MQGGVGRGSRPIMKAFMQGGVSSGSRPDIMATCREE